MAEGEQDSNPVKTDSADDDTDEESEVLEESPCGRWQKRREEVTHPNSNNESQHNGFSLSSQSSCKFSQIYLVIDESV